MSWANWLLGITAVALATMVEAETKTFLWEMSYITAAPNGVSRSVIGVNGQFPPPTIIVEKNDQVVIQVTNLLNDGEFITLHTHGIFQNGTNFFDGVDQVTQW
jgi:iron transport multicopper oxidase